MRLTGSPDRLLERLHEAGRLDLGDFMTFEVQPDAHHPELRNEGMQYEGMRFRAECHLAGKIYGQVFGVDIAFGDPMLGEPELITADDTLDFAGVAPPALRLYPVETHIAEKLHAYTLPRTRPNTRVKDLPDLALLASIGTRDRRHLRAAIDQTFTFRRTHAVPSTLPDPPAAWAAPYEQMAKENGLSWSTLADVTAAAATFLDAVLTGGEPRTGSTWSPEAWAWR